MATENMLVPARSYDFNLSIKDEDYSRDLYGVNIITSMDSAYQVFILDLHINAHDMVLNKIFGQDPIKLTVRYLGNDNIEQESIDYELMFINSNYKIPITEAFVENEKKGVQSTKTPLSIITIVRPSYKIMYSLVNKIYGYDFKETNVKTVITDMVNDLPKDFQAELDLNEDGINDTKIAQLILPPNTLYNSIRYLDNTLGLYHGPSFVFCKDKTVTVSNLASSMKKPEIFTVFHLSYGLENDDTASKIDNVQDGKQYYTYENISITENSNSKWNSIGNTIKYIVKPSDNLYSVIEFDLADIAKKYGLVDSTNDMHLDSAVDRVKYYQDHGGYNYSDFFIVSDIAKKLFNLASIEIRLQRSLRLSSLMDIGKSVMFKSKTMEYVDITGKYVLYSSDISFSKTSSGWQCSADIKLVRTSRLK